MHHTVIEGGPELLISEVLSSDEFELGVILLPRHRSDSGFVFSTNTTAVTKILRENGVKARLADVPGESVFRDERSFTWLGPVLFVSAAAYSENAEILSVSLGVIANYLTDIFKGQTSTTRAKLEIIAEVAPHKVYRKITYDGPVDGLRDLPSVVCAAVDQANKPEQ